MGRSPTPPSICLKRPRCGWSASAWASRRLTVARAELQIRFTENAQVDPQHLMRLVARNAKRGAQFTPQGVLKYPLSSARPDEVLLEIRELFANLAPTPVNV